MATTYYTLLTQTGLAKITNAQLTQDKVDITHIAIGDANGAPYAPSGTETALKNEKWRMPVAGFEIAEDNPNWIEVSGVLQASVGGFSVHEVGLYDMDGDLIAIGNFPGTYKPVLNDGATMDITIRTIIEVNNASAVNLVVDPNVVIASRKYVEVEINKNMTVVDQNIAQVTEQLDQVEAQKVAKVEGKQLSTNDYTNAEKTLVAKITEKANIDDVRESTFVRPINVTEMDTETKALFTGGAVAVVGVDAVDTENIRKEAVTANEVNFLEVIEENLYNQAATIVGKSIRASDGVMIDGANFAATDYIEVEVGKTYIGTSLSDGAFYNTNKEFVSGRAYTEGNTITIPEGVKYVRYTVSRYVYDLGTNMLVEGTVLPSKFRPYNNKKVTFKDVEFEKDSFLFSSINGVESKSFTNLYNQSKALVGSGIDPSNGGGVTNANYVATDFIEVEVGKTYIGKSLSDGAFYDANKNYLSGRSYTDGNTITIPEGAKYLRYTISKYYYDLGTNVLVEGTVLPTTFIPYEEKIYIPELRVKKDQIIGLNEKQGDEFNQLTWGQLGDSWTDAQGWQPVVMQELGIKASYTEAVIGSRIPKSDGQTVLSFIDRYRNLPDCDIITILGGINGAGIVPVGTLGTKDEYTHIGALQIIIEWYFTRNPNTRIFLIAPGPFWNYGTEPRVFNADLINYVTAMKQVAEYYGLPFLDLYHNLGINEFTRNALYSDGVHPNAKGNERIGRMISEFIKNNY